MEIYQARSPEAWHQVERLIRAYLAELTFEIDFQDLDRELDALANEYGPPHGAALLAYDKAEPTTDAIGVVGIRRFDDLDGELKRMYVSPQARGLGVGRALCEAAVVKARSLGYERLLLDTVDTMAAAIATYASLGFEEIEAYRHNPLPGARYFALRLVS
ncbi:MAG: GNAT family N-acetyltransferase [Actinomycetota bacterium]